MPAPAVIDHLEAATEKHPIDRKLLVCSSMGEGRELLRALARHRSSWIGWEVTTPKRLAAELVGPGLAEEGLAVADAFEEQAVVDLALDRATRAGSTRPLRELAEAPGFRQAVLNAVVALRLAGVAPGRLGQSPAANPAVRSLLTRVLRSYLELLAQRGFVDTAEVIERATAAIEIASAGATTDEAAPAPPGSRAGAGIEPWRTYLVPGLSRRGAGGRLIRALEQAGAVALESDPVVGRDPPPVVWSPRDAPAPLSGVAAGHPVGEGGATRLEMFAASGPAEEIREVLRRVMAAGLAWDDVEIIATDPVVYGGALHVAAERLGIPVSFAVGLPVERTRAGRATATYFRWIQGGYPADEIRRLLESGDLRVPPGGPGALALGRRLRRLRVGWGRERYLPAVDRALARLDPDRPRRGEDEAEARDRVERERAELEALRAILAPIVERAPALEPTRSDPLAPADVARGLAAFLERVAAADAPSTSALERLSAIAERIAATLDRPADPASAVALVRRHLEIRVPAPQREGAAPWVSSGGHLHLSDVEHGGYSARKRTFVVGLDADRFPGAGLQDPLLLDAQRRALDPVSLPSSADLLAARQFSLAACVARLRGGVTLSYSAWDPTEAREVAPASFLLQAYRSMTGRAGASFDELRRGLGTAASAVPAGGLLDDVDVWLRALRRDGILVQGTAAVRQAFPPLDAGLAAAEARLSRSATSHDGLVTDRPLRLDPRSNRDLVLSASGLEDLGTCGLRYLYRYGLGIRKPDDPEYDPDVWLDPMNRGSLLHSVYEAALARARSEGVAWDDPRLEALALEALEDEARRMARETPPPGAAVRAREMAALREDVRSFVAMVAEQRPEWEALELKFGLRGEPPAVLSLRGGELRLRGAVDRVDRTDRGLRVVDYKTGGVDRFQRNGTFHGGRRLQNAVYAAVIAAELEAPVHRMEYHFPTRTGQNEVVGYPWDRLRRGLALIDRLLDGVALGRFLPTEEPDDCRFCDYAPICRHRVEGYETVTPRADWASDRFGELPEYRERRDARAWEETFLAELEDHG